MPIFKKKFKENLDASKYEEEAYKRLFSKIGRDFVYKEDLRDVLNEIYFIIDPLRIRTGLINLDQNARVKAREYKQALESGRDVPYQDLINLDDI